jgi:hypothetical protein
MGQKIELTLLLLLLIIILFGFSNFNFTGFSTKEFAPNNFILEEDLIFNENQIIINISDYVVSRYNSTKSMVPVIDLNANGIGIHPNSPEEIFIGDIISFSRGEKLIVHRVIDKGVDKEGVYFITKGDNSFFNDGKVRFAEIDSVLVVLIY